MPRNQPLMFFPGVPGDVTPGVNSDIGGDGL